MSSPTPDQLASWRVFLETAFAVIDILDAELQAEVGITLRWYDVLVHLEGAPHGLRMSELAGRILASKSGLTRVVDRMEEAKLVRRERPASDRRAVEVHLTSEGVRMMGVARTVHRRGIQEHFVAHIGEADLAELARTLEGVRNHVRPLRPGRISR